MVVEGEGEILLSQVIKIVREDIPLATPAPSSCTTEGWSFPKADWGEDKVAFKSVMDEEAEEDDSKEITEGVYVGEEAEPP